MKTLMFALMAWASAHSGLPMPDDTPDIAFVPEDRLWGKVYAKADDVPDGNLHVRGAYRDGVIYLPRDWDKRDLGDLSILVHELVHYLQDEAGLDYRCRGERERPAYDAQMAWLEAANQDPYEVMGINPLFYALATTCEARTPGGGGIGGIFGD